MCRVGSGLNPSHSDCLEHSFLLLFCFILSVTMYSLLCPGTRVPPVSITGGLVGIQTWLSVRGTGRAAGPSRDMNFLIFGLCFPFPRE